MRIIKQKEKKPGGGVTGLDEVFVTRYLNPVEGLPGYIYIYRR